MVVEREQVFQSTGCLWKIFEPDLYYSYTQIGAQCLRRGVEHPELVTFILGGKSNIIQTLHCKIIMMVTIVNKHTRKYLRRMLS